MDAGVAEAIIRKSALKFLEHTSANTPKFNAYRLILQKPENTQIDPHWLLLPVAQLAGCELRLSSWERVTYVLCKASSSAFS